MSKEEVESIIRAAIEQYNALVPEDSKARVAFGHANAEQEAAATGPSGLEDVAALLSTDDGGEFEIRAAIYPEEPAVPEQRDFMVIMTMAHGMKLALAKRGKSGRFYAPDVPTLPQNDDVRFCEALMPALQHQLVPVVGPVEGGGIAIAACLCALPIGALNGRTLQWMLRDVFNGTRKVADKLLKQK